MVINIATLQGYQEEAVALGKDLGVVTRSLTNKELTRFGRSFERQFVIGQPQRQIVDIHMRHIKEALLGAIIAKEQMDAEIDDELPASNKVGGPLAIEAQWFGIGDDWEDIGSIYGSAVARGQGAWTTGAPQNWIHSGTLLLGGTDANPIRIGENAVHIIYGLGSSHPSPRIESIQFTIDGKLKPKLLTFWSQRLNPGAARPIKELDNAIPLVKDTTLLARIFISEAFGEVSARQTDFPRLYGVSYIKEPALRLLDPVTGAGRVLPGARYDVVWTT